MNKNNRFKFILFFILVSLLFINANVGYAAPVPTVPNISLEIGGSQNPREISQSIELILFFTILSLLPSIIIMMTSFTRIIIVLSFLKTALGAQQSIPSQILIGLSLFLTFFIMAPVGTQIYEDALLPYYEEEIGQQEAISKAMVPLREFMLKQTRQNDINLFLDITKDPVLREKVNNNSLNIEEIPNTVIIPAFIISELKTGMQIGFLLFIPFIIVDMVVANVLMSMGMMMLPPMLISLPFKILLFILVDGWNIVIESIIKGFN